MDKRLKELQDDVGFLLEEAILEVTEAICKEMEKQKVSRADLAKRLNKSRAFITRMLNGQPNLTIKTMVEVANALDSKIHPQLVRKTSKAFISQTWVDETKVSEVSKFPSADTLDTTGILTGAPDATGAKIHVEATRSVAAGV